ncbi:hypothetical protein G3M53_67955 [Streptomyces sp. SID7982]|nr:hypothetical protein [Streptomyces sp. SID7982]
MTFEIRIICDPDDADRVRDKVAEAFRVGTARQYPTRDRMRVRLYITAEHHDPDAQRKPNA